ncbi:MAG: SAM-dependent methyltransferase [Bacteroidaceae bacterium]|nr:SAM-dependent methyltransferase [Bacteroidaceae bacterium]
MILSSPLQKKYTQEQMSAREAQHYAELIAWGPAIFQVSRLMLKFGILDTLRNADTPLTREEIVEQTGLSDYAVKCLLEASLCIGTILIDTTTDRFTLSKTGWFLLNDAATRVNINFNHDVNYVGWHSLEQSLINGKPEGLKQFGNWPTLYEGLSSLPSHVQESWFAFDHFYSDSSFPEALEIVFRKNRTKTLYDVGGNTGKWALKCVEYDKQAKVTILDLPQQIEMMRKNIAGKEGADRISGYPINLLDTNSSFPVEEGMPDAIWMSQFLDCFSMDEMVSILKRAKSAMGNHTRLYIMETLWDRQRFHTAAMCLTMTSLYFTTMANGNSKMYNTEDITSCITDAGLQIEEIYDNLGQGHSIIKVSFPT